jgi:hypothetical protein
MNYCYCNGYGICFGNAKNLDLWIEKDELRVKTAKKLDKALKEGREGRIIDELRLRNETLTWKLRGELEEAFRRGEKMENRLVECERELIMP